MLQVDGSYDSPPRSLAMFQPDGLLGMPTIDITTAAMKDDKPTVQINNDDDVIEYSTPKRRAGLRTPKKNMSLKALENMNSSLDR